MNSKNLVQLCSLVLIAGLSMGNQSCEQAQLQNRQLKKIIEVGHIQSQTLVLPDGSRFDFQFVVNQQIYSVLYANKEFAFRYQTPIQGLGTSLGGIESTRINLTENDQGVLRKLGLGSLAESGGVRFSKEAQCMMNMPQAKIAGSVNSFELIGGGGLTLGFNSAGPVSSPGLSSLGFQVKVSQLAMSMRALSPMTSNVMGALDITSKQTQTAVNFNLLFGQLSLGPSFFFQTPLAKVTAKALTKGVAGLKTQLEAYPWQSRVLMDHENLITIIGGINVGLQIGDQVAIYNKVYYWDGEPCASKLLYEGGLSPTPVAIIEIQEVADEISLGRPISETGEPRYPGALVQIHKLNQPPASTVIAKK
jgi:hypothetical protein